MKLSEIAHFSEDKYRQNIADKYASDQDLGTEIYKKRAKRLSSKVRVGVGAAAAPLTGGGTLVSAAFSGRTSRSSRRSSSYSKKSGPTVDMHRSRSASSRTKLFLSFSPPLRALSPPGWMPCSRWRRPTSLPSLFQTLKSTISSFPTFTMGA